MKIQTKQLNELCTIAKGKKVKIIDEKTKNSIPYLLINTLRGKEPEFFTEDGKYTEAVPGDVLIVADGANSGLVGTGVNGAVGSTILRIRINVDDLDKDYLSYFLKSNFARMNKDLKGTGIPHLKSREMMKMEIRKPELKEQQKIVSVIETQFSRLDEVVENLRSVKRKLGVYGKAVLKKGFERGEGWSEKTIGNVFLTNPQKREIKELPDDLEISFIPMKFVSAKLRKITNKEIKKLSKVRKGYTYFKDEDIILAKITPCFENGKMAIARELTNGIGFGSTEFHVFRFKEEVLSEFLYYFFQQNYFRSEAKRNMTGTAGQLRVPVKFIEDFSISFPSIKEQQKIVQNIESKFSVIDKVEEIVNQSLVKAERLRKAVLKVAFEGRLV